LPVEEELQGIVEVERIDSPVLDDVHLPEAGERPRGDGDDIVDDLPEYFPCLFLRELVALRAILGNPGLFLERRGGGGKEQSRNAVRAQADRNGFIRGLLARGSLLFRWRGVHKKALVQLYTGLGGMFDEIENAGR